MSKRYTVHLSKEEFEWIRAMRAAKVCDSKKPYDTKDEALRMVIKRTQTFTNPAPPLYPYPCPTCGKWHLTSKPPRPKGFHPLSGTWTPPPTPHQPSSTSASPSADASSGEPGDTP